MKSRGSGDGDAVTNGWQGHPLKPFVSLFLPADSSRVGVMEDAGPAWMIAKPSDDVDQFLWGRSWVPSRTPISSCLRFAAKREFSLLRMRAGALGTFEVVTVHRLSPPLFGGRGVRHRVSRALRSGALMEMSRSASVRRVIDVASEAAGVVDPILKWRLGSGAVALARVQGPSRSSVLLRVAPEGLPGDPAHAADALERLESAGASVIPRLVAKGRHGGTSWTTESILPGHAPRRVDHKLIEQVGRVLSRLPRYPGPPRALERDLGVIRRYFPLWASPIQKARSTLEEVLSALPAIVRHGDLWGNNLLVKGVRLSGILDWDSWYWSGVPGADLAYLFLSEERRRMGGSLGNLWRGWRWRSQAFKTVTADYWKRVDVLPDDAVLGAVGIAAWAAQIATTLERAPQLVDNPLWVRNGPMQLVIHLDDWPASEG